INTKVGADYDLSFAHMDDVDLLPIIRLIPKDAKLSKFTFRISIGMPHGSIPLEKTQPSKNCLRQIVPGGSENKDRPTPFYNSAICSSAAFSINDSRVRTAIDQSPAFRETSRVGQLWLRQRGFSSSTRCG